MAQNNVGSKRRTPTVAETCLTYTDYRNSSVGEWVAQIASTCAASGPSL